MAAELELRILGDSTLGSHDSGWLRAILMLDGEPYWVADTEAGFDWTWIDLLAYLAEHWPALMLEDGWPLPLSQVANPAELMRHAEERWQDLPSERIDEEEVRLLAFMERHNLAAAFNGAYLPMLLWCRAGKTLWLATEDDSARRVDFASARGRLEDIGNQLAEAFGHSAHPHIRATLSAWNRRAETLNGQFLTYRSGLSVERLEPLRAQIDVWRPCANEDPVESDPPALAVARMSRFVLATDQLGVLMRRLQALPGVRSAVFAELAPMALRRIEACASLAPWQQGYELAAWLRGQLALSPEACADPEALLRGEGVLIETLELDTPHLDAIACWGHVQPTVLLNRHPRARPAHHHGRRSTLAHELAHLLVDRERALPVAEVLGGEVDLEAEKRANAFAAEWLLPRAWAAQVLRQSRSIDQAIETLSRSHAVSAQLAARQMLNAQTVLSEDERIRLRQYTDN